MTDLPLPLKLARFRLDCTVEAPIHLHYYAGSQLRGAFGHALRRTACVTRQQDCHACPLYRSCAYPEIFETPAPERHRLQRFSQVPNPYVVEPPPLGARDYPAGAALGFHCVLMGRALRHLPLVVYAWKRALERPGGLGGGHVRLDAVTYVGPDGSEQRVYAEGGLSAPAVAPVPVPALADRAVVEFETPLRLQAAGGVRGHAMTARDVLMALARRYWLLAEFHQAAEPAVDFAGLGGLAGAVELTGELRWRDWRRFSSRQRQEMVLGGVLGRVTLRGALAPFAGLLAAGQWTHLGKNASFGLGRYRLCQENQGDGESQGMA
ncbi:Uncharacterized conserved protein [Methylomagnum ishizawai]|uniref:Uncharacterized conserved protein n=1 Tax=Methylomagnum ishizawai TaxID=1760988 RepID=A0A1Y6D2Y8_9GAMM|nr:CRISPR system precrRNA processing endoribonuclease RAMP protein Cas6 [Methylomagnum ishizawai]SMF96971.1 Uncharacterized conserved protein [Methylomagnum ishizawai]